MAKEVGERRPNKATTYYAYLSTALNRVVFAVSASLLLGSGIKSDDVMCASRNAEFRNNGVCCAMRKRDGTDEQYEDLVRSGLNAHASTMLRLTCIATTLFWT